MVFEGEGWGCVSLLIRMQKKRVFVEEVLVNPGMLDVSFLSGPFSFLLYLFIRVISLVQVT